MITIQELERLIQGHLDNFEKYAIFSTDPENNRVLFEPYKQVVCPTVYFFRDYYNDLLECIVKPYITNKANVELYAKYVKLNDMLVELLTSIIVNKTSGLLQGQMVFNASAVTEYTLHTKYGLAFGGNGDFDHLYMHGGVGFPGTDFVLDTPITFNTVKAGDIVLEAGTSIDVKDYLNRQSMYEALDANTDGKLGHYGDWLLCHFIGSDTDWYLTKNRAGSEIYRVTNLELVQDRKQVRFRIDTNGFLKVSNFI